MKIVLPGGSGQIGTLLARAFHADRHEVVVLSRSPRPAPWRVAAWDGVTSGPWTCELNGADVVINLAGSTVHGRYNSEERRQILESRVFSTGAIGEAIARATRPPRTWLQMSTATIYAHRHDAPNDEATGRMGDVEPEHPSWEFSVHVARAWEDALCSAITPHTRRVALRSAIVQSAGRGGFFDIVLGLVRHGLGGTTGNGRQMVSWIHEDDFVNAVRWLIEHEEIDGPVNVVSPNAVPNREFMRDLRRAWGTPIGLPASSFVLEFGTWLMRTESELVLKSRWVRPARLLERGFQFAWPDWKTAAVDLCRRWRSDRH